VPKKVVILNPAKSPAFRQDHYKGKGPSNQARPCSFAPYAQ